MAAAGAATTVAPPAGPAAAAATTGRDDDDDERMRALLVEQLATRTGYPSDMLSPELDLEADLGIDTVKQVAVIADVKGRLGLPRDPDFKLRDHNTIGRVAAYLARFARAHGAPAPKKDAPPPRAPDEPLPAAQTAARPPRPAAADNEEVQRLLLERAVQRTGYPADMLELDLDLEADLGIDTVKQVAIIAETKQALSLPRDPGFKLRDHNTLRKIVAYLSALVAARAGPPPFAVPAPGKGATPPPHPANAPAANGAAPAPSTPASTGAAPAVTAASSTSSMASRAPPASAPAGNAATAATTSIASSPGAAPGARLATASTSITSTSAAPTAGAPPFSPRGALATGEIQGLLVDRAAQRTGYPVDMLDLDLDLEADLGIDTVKQVAVIAEVKQRLGLPRDPAFKLRDHNTLRKVVAYLERSLGRGDGPAAAPAASAPVDGGAQTIGVAPTIGVAAVRVDEVPAPQPAAAAATEEALPPDMRAVGGAVELALRAPGVVEIGAAEGSAILSEIAAVELLVDAARRGGGIGRLVALENLAFHREVDGLPRVSAHVGAWERGAARVRITSSSGRTHADGLVTLDASAPREAARVVGGELRVALSHRREQQNGAKLEDVVARAAGRLPTGATVHDATLLSHDEVVAQIRLASTPTGATDAAAVGSVLHGAFAIASLGWHVSTRRFFVLSRIRAVRFSRAPIPGEELLVRARLLPLHGGLLRAQVVAVDGEGRHVADIAGMEAAIHDVYVELSTWRLACQALRPQSPGLSGEQW